MRSNELELYKRTLTLTPAQRSIMVGTLLGDGHLETQNGRKTFRLKIEHTVSQRFYTDWLYEQLHDWVRTPPASKTKQIGDSSSTNDWFQTMSVAQFRFYGLQFYDAAGRKHVPKIIQRLLTPLAMAVWFMDDGSAKSRYHRAIVLNTHSFSRRDIAKLQQALLQRYCVQSSVRTQKDGLQILIAGHDAERLMESIRPYVLPEFYYKFGALVNTLPKE